MWDFFETVHRRHSVRKYQTDMPVEQEKLHAILGTACAAPSAGDLQSYRIIVVTRPDTRDQLRQRAHDQAFIAEAPVCLVFCCDHERAAEQFGERGRELFALQDATIAAWWPREWGRPGWATSTPAESARCWPWSRGWNRWPC